ncbi:MAG: 4-(cytidine 5'-diphospho)-2-C-methyl-D-erythritol kinase [Alphaproteobacteria bacterium]|nr:4-(cytidine 5'-diphospho)-2-C-methyl-D-erythritol kinase [Alphaproteobacteria bacterium]
MTLAEFAPAKINLYLHVTGKRGDGYHLLDSLVVFAGIGDSVSVAPAEHLTLAIDGPMAAGLAADSSNIVWKAAEALAARAGNRAGAAITLTKRLPVASGIGGGSADAAATLRALERLWGITLPAADRHGLALSLGADVPVCLAGRPARMSGVGERLEPVPALPPLWLALINPRVPLSTPAVFKARQTCFSDPAPLETMPRDAAHLAALLAARRNDLTAAAISLAPEVATALAGLAACDGCLLARMSGSGATCLGLFASAEAAAGAARTLGGLHPGWWCESAPMLT